MASRSRHPSQPVSTRRNSRRTEASITSGSACHDGRVRDVRRRRPGFGKTHRPDRSRVLLIASATSPNNGRSDRLRSRPCDQIAVIASSINGKTNTRPLGVGHRYERRAARPDQPVSKLSTTKRRRSVRPDVNRRARTRFAGRLRSEPGRTASRSRGDASCRRSQGDRCRQAHTRRRTSWQARPPHGRRVVGWHGTEDGIPERRRDAVVDVGTMVMHVMESGEHPPGLDARERRAVMMLEVMEQREVVVASVETEHRQRGEARWQHQAEHTRIASAPMAITRNGVLMSACTPPWCRW